MYQLSTPFERLFQYEHQTATGCSTPSWILSAGPVLLKKHVRISKYGSLIEEVQQIEANPQYVMLCAIWYHLHNLVPNRATHPICAYHTFQRNRDNSFHLPFRPKSS